MTIENTNQLPEFLQSYENLNTYIRETLDDLDNTSKGRSFARFVSKVIPISSLGERFVEIELGPDSKDGGIDLTSYSSDGNAVLYGQSKLTLSRVEDLDVIISKFKDYYERVHTQKTLQMFAFPELVVKQGRSNSKKKRTKAGIINIGVDENGPEEVLFVIVTLSRIRSKILPEYEKSRMASKDFYNTLKAERRIVILDGNDVLPLAQSSYRKLYDSLKY